MGSIIKNVICGVAASAIWFLHERFGLLASVPAAICVGAAGVAGKYLKSEASELGAIPTKETAAILFAIGEKAEILAKKEKELSELQEGFGDAIKGIGSLKDTKEDGLILFALAERDRKINKLTEECEKLSAEITALQDLKKATPADQASNPDVQKTIRKIERLAAPVIVTQTEGKAKGTITKRAQPTHQKIQDYVDRFANRIEKVKYCGPPGFINNTWPENGPRVQRLIDQELDEMVLGKEISSKERDEIKKALSRYFKA